MARSCWLCTWGSMQSVEERFWAKVDKTDTCWLWVGATTTAGYGRFTITLGYRKPQSFVQAHRFSYELLIGPIPAGLTIDHLCRTPACVRPDHLEPVTMRENILRGNSVAAANAAKTHCPQGHPYDEYNTYPGHNHHRMCVSCTRLRSTMRSRRKVSMTVKGVGQ